MFKLPPALLPIYGPESPYRIWAYVMTFCLVLCLPRATRRMGAIAFVAVLAAMLISNFLNGAYKSFTPSATPTPLKARRTY